MELISQKTSPELFREIQQFNEILQDLSIRLTSVNPYELDGEINRGLDLISRFFNSDLKTLCKSGEEKLFDGAYYDPKNSSWKDSFFKSDIIKSTSPFILNQDFNEENSDPFLRQQFLTKIMLEELHYFGEIMVKALERKRTAGWDREFTRFEHFLSDISTAYNNLPVDEIEKVIIYDLGRLAKLLAADRCILYVFGEDINNFLALKPFFWRREEDYIPPEDEDKWTFGFPDYSSCIRFLFDKWIKGESINCAEVDGLPFESRSLKDFFHSLEIKSFMSIPISSDGSYQGALLISSIQEQRRWPDDLIRRVRPIGEVYLNAVKRKHSEERFRNALLEIKKLKVRMGETHILDKEKKFSEDSLKDVVGEGNAFRHVLQKVRQVAATDATVVLLGETGVGKGIIAKAIHKASLCGNKSLVQVNCASFAPSLIESELFGHEKGAFTSANSKRIGCFERARGTSLFLDEIGELPPELQAKLLRVLQDGEFERVGGSETLKTDARIIVATNKDMEKEIEAGRFRRDLWYRLNIFPITIPPLRERTEDIPQFLNLFIEKYSGWAGKHVKPVPKKTIEALKNYSWPGNIRELENLVLRAVIASSNGDLEIEIPVKRADHPDNTQRLKDLERAHIIETLNETLWRIEGTDGAANRLGLKASTLRMRMKKLDIRRPIYSRD